MITVIDSTGQTVQEYDDWKRGDVERMIVEHNATHDDQWSVYAEPVPEPTKSERLAVCLAQRRAAYAAESDPLKIEAEYDALIKGSEPDYTAWRAKVAEIKARIPKPKR